MKNYKTLLISESIKVSLAIILSILLPNCGSDNSDSPAEEPALLLPESTVEPPEAMIPDPISLEGIWIAPGTGNCVFFMEIGKTSYKDGAICGDDSYRIKLYHVFSYVISENSIYGTMQVSECSPELEGEKIVKPFARDGNNLTTTSRQWVLATKMPPAVFTCP